MADNYPFNEVALYVYHRNLLYILLLNDSYFLKFSIKNRKMKNLIIR